MDQRVETIMHLAMNTQKAVFKLVLQWASSMEKGKELSIFDGKRERIEKPNQTYDRISSRIASSLHTLPHVQE
jgi:hypothetical protein